MCTFRTKTVVPVIKLAAVWTPDLSNCCPFCLAVGTHQTDVRSILQHQQVLRSRKEEKKSFTRIQRLCLNFFWFYKQTNKQKQQNNQTQKQTNKKNSVKDHKLNCLFSIPLKSPCITGLLTLEYMLLSVSPYILLVPYCQPCPSMLLGLLFPGMLKYQRELQFLTDR